MTAKDSGVRKDGEKILNNYKKQLAEKLAREAAEGGRDTNGSRLSALSRSRPSGRSKCTFEKTSETSIRTKERELEQQKLV